MPTTEIFRLHIRHTQPQLVQVTWLAQKVPLWANWRKITVITWFKVTQGHYFRYQSKTRMWLSAG